MTYKPIPEHRRRELAPLVPELTRKFKSWLGAPATGESERDFWQRELPRDRLPRGVSFDAMVWLIRQARSGAGCIDPVQITNYTWPERCKLTGPKAARERWPLEPIPDKPKVQPTPEGPLVDGTPVKEGDVLYYVGRDASLLNRALVAGSRLPGGSGPSNSVWFPELKGWLLNGVLSRTKPIIIEGRVVKPGDVLYHKPTMVRPEIAGQERTVREVLGTDGLRFTNGSTCGSPETMMTYVTPSVEPARTTGKSPTLAAPFGASLTATQRIMEAERNRFLRACLDDVDYLSRFINRIPGVKLEGAIHDELNFSVPHGVDLDFSRVEERIAPQMEAYRLAFDLEPVKLEPFKFDPAVLSISTKEKHAMNQTAQQATPTNAHVLTVDTSNIVEVKTFVFGRDIVTLDDDLLLNYVERLTNAIEHLEDLNARTPLAKLVTKIAQLKDAKAKIVDLLGGAPVPADSDGGTKGGPLVEPQPRKRRTKAEMESDNAKAVRATPVPPAPPAPTQPEPSVADVDLDD